MKNNRTFRLLTSAFLVCISFILNGQTNVTGGIFSNTTWSVTGSPYIVSDTVAVFPGVTLTIQPGVTVRFNNKGFLWIKQGILLAEGVTTDSITLTSNFASPAPGNWNGIFVDNSVNTKFNFCKILYSSNGISSSNHTISIRNSRFSHNQSGGTISYGSYVDSCLIQNNVYGLYCYGRLSHSSILNNQYGITGAATVVDCKVNFNSVHGIRYSGGVDSIARCEIKNNGIGIDVVYGTITIFKNRVENNSVGIQLGNDPYPQTVICNKICSNTAYDFRYLNTISSINISGNYWCTADSAIVFTHIYDGHDNVSYMLAYYTPMDNSSCYSITTSVKENEIINYLVYPNPAFESLNIDFPQNNLAVEISIYNLIGEKIIHYSSLDTKTGIPISHLMRGVYFIEIVSDKKISRQKFIKN